MRRKYFHMSIQFYKIFKKKKIEKNVRLNFENYIKIIYKKKIPYKKLFLLIGVFF